jgi:hypothetical protein
LTVSFPEDPFEELVERYGTTQLREWAKATLIRAAIRSGLIDRGTGRALLRAGFGKLVTSDIAEFMDGSIDAA